MARSRGGPDHWAAFVVLGAGALLAVAALGRLTRYAVSGPSMAPALRDGDWVVVDRAAYRRRRPRPGEVVIVTDPRDRARELIKRLTRVGDDGRWWVEGDNPAASTDSRSFGPVEESAIAGRVLARYWPTPRWLCAARSRSTIASVGKAKAGGAAASK